MFMRECVCASVREREKDVGGEDFCVLTMMQSRQQSEDNQGNGGVELTISRFTAPSGFDSRSHRQVRNNDVVQRRNKALASISTMDVCYTKACPLYMQEYDL